MNIITKLKNKYTGLSYGDEVELRMFNTKIFRILVKSKTMGLLNGLDITNKKGDVIKIRYNDNGLSIILKIGNCDNDITSLCLSNNKYGSAVIKRFFKDYSKLLLEVADDYIKSRLSRSVQELLFNRLRSKVITKYRNLDGNTLSIGNNKMVLEFLDSGNTIVIENNPSVTQVVSFLKNYIY